MAPPAPAAPDGGGQGSGILQGLLAHRAGTHAERHRGWPLAWSRTLAGLWSGPGLAAEVWPLPVAAVQSDAERIPGVPGDSGFTDASLTYLAVGVLAVCTLCAVLALTGAWCSTLQDLVQEDAPPELCRVALRRGPPAKAGFDAASVMPALCDKLLTPNGDMPLLVPLRPLQATAAWTVPVLAGLGRRPLLLASLSSPGEPSERRVSVAAHGAGGATLGSIDAQLQVFGADGSCFGRLQGREDDYVLIETSGRPPKLTVRSTAQGGFEVMELAPFGPSAPLEPPKWGQWPAPEESRLVATVSLHGSECLGVMTTPGVDAVLMLICALGLVAFEVLADEDAAGPTAALAPPPLRQAASPPWAPLTP